MINIVVGIITYKRPVELNKLLVSIEKLNLEPLWSVLIIVVDNDPGESGKSIVSRFNRFEFKYYVELTKGIPYARNKILFNTPEDADYLILIDDDEFVPVNWIKNLMQCQIKYSAMAVLGAVHPIFESNKDTIISNYFIKEAYEEGESVLYGSTCNVLFDWKKFKKLNLIFDIRMRFTGGSDTLLFMELIDHKSIIKFSKKSYVYEAIPDSRANINWILKRCFREGCTYVLSNRLRSNGIYSFFVIKEITLSVIILCILFPLLFVPFIFDATNINMKRSRRLGIICSIFGFTYEEYK